MTQTELERHIARLTGEDLYEVRRRGFSICQANLDVLDQEAEQQGPQALDWDEPSPGDGPEAVEIKRLVDLVI